MRPNLKFSLIRKILVAIAVICVLCVFPQKLSADIGMSIKNVYYFVFDNDGENEIERFVSYPLVFFGEISEANQAYAVFSNIFENFQGDLIPFIPDGVSLISVDISEDVLIINVSGEICGYGGGSAYEYGLVRQITKNAAQIAGVSKVTLLIGGFSETLPEGTILYETPISETP